MMIVCWVEPGAGGVCGLDHNDGGGDEGCDDHDGGGGHDGCDGHDGRGHEGCDGHDGVSVGDDVDVGDVVLGYLRVDDAAGAVLV